MAASHSWLGSLPLYTDLLEREIRLLTLYPSQSSSFPITASLSVASLPVDSLSDGPYYEALSYVWGLRDNREPTISLSGHNITVRENLFAALCALRDRKEAKILWIDALCINQNDVVEKASQINLMKHIYMNCASCWLWLGKEKSKNETEAAIMLIKNWASGRHLNINLNFNSTCIKIASELTPRDWFSRIWTVQESTFPKNLVVLCGSYKLPWIVFADAAKSVQKHLASPCCISHNDTENAYMEDVKKFLHAVSTIERSRKLGHENSEILTCLHLYRNRQATQAHDKIFGLLNLVDPSGQSLVEVNYQKSVEDLYTSLCIEHIKQTRSLEILKYVLFSAEKSKFKATLPSWVPDWTLDTPEPRWQKGRLDRYCLYNSCGNQSSQPEFVKTSKSYVLRESGVCCGVVTIVGSERHAEKGKGSKESEEKGQVIPKDWAGLAKTNGLLKRGKTRAAFWSTILMDTVGESADRKVTSLRRASEADYKEYEDLLKHITNGTGWPADTDRIYMALETATLLQKFFITKDGHFGIGPAGMEVGDEVYVLNGGCRPLVLRSAGQGSRYKLIGDCFLTEYMDGEAMVEFDSCLKAVCIE